MMMAIASSTVASTIAHATTMLEPTRTMILVGMQMQVTTAMAYACLTWMAMEFAISLKLQDVKMPALVTTTWRLRMKMALVGMLHRDTIVMVFA